MPASEEEEREEDASRIRAHHLDSEHETPTNSTVLGPPTLDKFGFSLRHIEGDSLNLSDHRNEEKGCSKWHDEDVPSVACLDLEVDYFEDVERA